MRQFSPSPRIVYIFCGASQCALSSPEVFPGETLSVKSTLTTSDLIRRGPYTPSASPPRCSLPGFSACIPPFYGLDLFHSHASSCKCWSIPSWTLLDDKAWDCRCDLCFQNLGIDKHFSFLVSYILSRNYQPWLNLVSVFVSFRITNRWPIF